MKRFQKNAVNILTGIILLAVFSACAAFKPVTKEVYSKDDLTFTHLSNWRVTDDSTTTVSDITTRIITLEGPNSAILSITRFPPIVPMTLDEYVEIIGDEMKKGAKDLTGGVEVISVDDGKTMPSEAQIAGALRQGLAREFDVKALGTPVPHRAEYYLLENDKERWFFTRQASKDNWDETKDGFQTILDSFPVRTKN